MNQLKAFEAAARLGSFRDAGDELNVTHSAVSHQIKALEQYLGATLFQRQSRGVRMTDAAQPLFEDVRQALDLLANSTAQFKNSGLSGTLKISVAPSFASRWLLKRLQSFEERFPAIVVDVDIAANRQDFERSQIDVAIRHGSGDWRGLVSENLLEERLWLVGSAQVVTAIQDQSGAINLERTRLLTASGRGYEWDAWFDMSDTSTGDHAMRYISFPTQALALDGAVSGLGVTFADYRLVADEIRDGRLARITSREIRTGRGFYFVWQKRASTDAKLIAFKEWLFSELARSFGE
ncbi:MAG: LysR substrate-binding domain-containing protein [Hyphomicrobiaceae bacterium]